MYVCKPRTRVHGIYMHGCSERDARDIRADTHTDMVRGACAVRSKRKRGDDCAVKA